MNLADLIIESGPFTQDLLVGPGFAGPLHWLRADALNELREELVAGRQAAEDLREFLDREDPT